MSIGPILPGRLPNSLASSRLQASLQQINRELARLQDQAATGQKFFLPSESPREAVQTVALQRTIERQDHYSSNILTERSFLSASETAMTTAADAASRAKTLILQGVGLNTGPAEKQSLALEAGALLTSVVNAANTLQSGRYVFAGSDAGQPPFEILDNGYVRYNGDTQELDSYIGNDLRLALNVDGNAAFSALSPPVTADVNPALSLDSRLSDLLNGRGAATGPIQVTVDDGLNPVSTQTVDLTGAQTIRDIKTRLEAAFPANSLTVAVDPTTRNSLQLTAAVGVTVSDVSGSTVARQLGIVGGPAATISGNDLDPKMTLETKLSDFRGGLGLANPAGTFVISNGDRTATIDVSGAVTVQDLFNRIREADVDVSLDINANGNGLSIRSRLSGALFSISENGGSTATDLGIRTLNASTRLADLNRGMGVPVDNGSTLNIQLTDGTVHNIDLSAARTIQDVINAVNNAGNPNLTASLNSVGNGITITDSSIGANGFSIEANSIGTALGLNGSLAGSGSIVGTDVNPQEPQGLMGLLLNIRSALNNNSDSELNRLDAKTIHEVERINLVRGDIGSRQGFLSDVENRLEDYKVVLQASLSDLFDADITEVITRLSQTSSMLQATLQIASRLQQLSLTNFL